MEEIDPISRTSLFIAFTMALLVGVGASSGAYLLEFAIGLGHTSSEGVPLPRALLQVRRPVRDQSPGNAEEAPWELALAGFKRGRG